MKIKANFGNLVFAFVAVAMGVYHMVMSQRLFVTTFQHYTAHISFALLIIFLSTLIKNKSKFINALLFVAVLFSLVCWIYIHFSYNELLDRCYFNTPADLAIGGGLICLVIAAAWISYGPVIPCLAIGTMIYPFFGQYLPDPFFCQAQSFERTIASLSVCLEGGVFSTLMSISANYIFLFVLFGGILGATGATKFFLDLGMLIGSKIKGGPGIMAVVSSALVGSVTGSVAANIAITGSFTIPLMKKI